MRVMILAWAVIVETSLRVAAQELYPWCSQRETLHCYYMTREQCELTLDYHGFCVANPELASAPMNQATLRSRSVRRAERGGGG